MKKTNLLNKPLPKQKKRPPKEPSTQRMDNDHDIFLRALMSIMALVQLQLEYVVPVELRQYMDFSTLKPVPDTHVDDKLSYSASDCIFECDFLRSTLPLKYRSIKKMPKLCFYFLIEGKSSAPSVPIDFQIEAYRRMMWLRDKKNKKFPGIVIPIIIYNGKDAWRKKKIYDRFEWFLPQEVLSFLPNPKYLVIDLHDLPDEVIQNEVNLGALRGAYLAMKHGHEESYFKDKIPNLLKFAEGFDTKDLLDSFIQMLLEYIQRRSKLSETEITNIVLNSNDKDMRTKIKTVFESIEERATAEGIALGEAKSEDKVKEAQAEAKKAKEEARIAKAEAKEEARIAKAEAKEEARIAKAEAKEEARIAKAEAKIEIEKAKAEFQIAKSKQETAQAIINEQMLRTAIAALIKAADMTDEQLMNTLNAPAELVASVRVEMDAKK
jgi:Putative transposase, YhgA-like